MLSEVHYKIKPKFHEISDPALLASRDMNCLEGQKVFRLSSWVELKEDEDLFIFWLPKELMSLSLILFDGEGESWRVGSKSASEARLSSGRGVLLVKTKGQYSRPILVLILEYLVGLPNAGTCDGRGSFFTMRQRHKTHDFADSNRLCEGSILPGYSARFFWYKRSLLRLTAT